MWQYNYPDEPYHHGVLGMKWGKRHSKTGYHATSIKSAMARRSNDKVDASFTNWKTNSTKKEDAISLGKTANASKMAYQKNRRDRDLKVQYKTDNKAYKKALKSNTTYRKGTIKGEVGQDASRKYLSEAKKVKKQMTNNPSDKALQKQYSKLMNKYDVERASSRRAPKVADNRSKKKAVIKRTMTMSVKTAAASAAVAGGAYAVNKYLQNHKVTLNGRDIRVNTNTINGIGKAVEVGKELFKYI